MTATNSIASDTFIRSNQSSWGTDSNSVYTWSQVRGSMTWAITSNKGTCNSASSSTFNVFQLGSQTPTAQEILVRVIPSDTTDIGIVARYNSTSQFYYGILSGSNLVIGMNNSGFSTIASASFSYTAGSAYWLRFKLIGSSLLLKGWADGSGEPTNFQVTHTDTTFSSGGFGLGSDSGSSTNTQFDSFTVTNGSKILSLPARTVVRTQVTKSLPVRVLIRTKSTKTLAARTIARTLRSLTLPARTIARTLHTVTLPLRSNIRTLHTITLPLRTIVRSASNTVTKKLPLRTMVRTMNTVILPFRTVIRTVKSITLPLRSNVRTLRTMVLSVRSRVRIVRIMTLPLRVNVILPFTTKTLSFRVRVRTSSFIKTLPLRIIVSITPSTPPIIQTPNSNAIPLRGFLGCVSILPLPLLPYVLSGFALDLPIIATAPQIQGGQLLSGSQFTLVFSNLSIASQTLLAAATTSVPMTFLLSDMSWWTHPSVSVMTYVVGGTNSTVALFTIHSTQVLSKRVIQTPFF